MYISFYILVWWTIINFHFWRFVFTHCLLIVSLMIAGRSLLDSTRRFTITSRHIMSNQALFQNWIAMKKRQLIRVLWSGYFSLSVKTEIFKLYIKNIENGRVTKTSFIVKSESVVKTWLYWRKTVWDQYHSRKSLNSSVSSASSSHSTVPKSFVEDKTSYSPSSPLLANTTTHQWQSSKSQPVTRNSSRMSSAPNATNNGSQFYNPKYPSLFSFW